MRIGLCEGRHPMPVDKYTFPNCVPMFDLTYMRETIANKIPKNTYRVGFFFSNGNGTGALHGKSIEQ